MLLIVLEYAGAAMFILVLVTQVLWPLLQGRPIFPFFRKGRKLERRLGVVREAIDNDRLETAITKEEGKLRK